MSVSVHEPEFIPSMGRDTPEEWDWPVPPSNIRLFDKYADRELTVGVADSEWCIPSLGVVRRVQFSGGAAGTLQRTVALLTHGTRSPSALLEMAERLVENWEVLLNLLSLGPLKVRRRWTELAPSRRLASCAKAILSLACRSQVGAWLPIHLALVKGLPSGTNRSTTHVRRIENRERVLSLGVLGAIAKLLDSASLESATSPLDVEGLAALALAFQHGMRPVQLLAVEVRHVSFYEDAHGDAVCIVSFHAAKQADGGSVELKRQVRPEWVPLLQALHAQAIADCRNRLFSSKTSTLLMAHVSKACKRRGLEDSFNLYDLRHSAVQSLADGGHSRGAIQEFLGHKDERSANAYMAASRSQAQLINIAIGASKLYETVLSFADGKFISLQDLAAAEDDNQVGGVVGDRLVAGIGLCKSGQPSCRYNPVTSCYGCEKFMPSLDRDAHEEAVAGMRSQVLVYLQSGLDEASPAYRQLTKALSGAQQTLAAIEGLSRGRQ